MSASLAPLITSEIGPLEAVVLHPPGPEIENMSPLEAERALYSDILNLGVATAEYAQLAGVLRRVCRVFETGELLTETLADAATRRELIAAVCRNEAADCLCDELSALEPAALTAALIGGVPLRRDTLTSFLSRGIHALRPLHNLFFMRDTAAVVGRHVLLSRMANAVRERESLLMSAIFARHPLFRAPVVDPIDAPGATIEGGDVLVARSDVLIVGIGARTTPQAVDFLIARVCADGGIRHVVVQELPTTPESFIHLDMVFTLLDRDLCLVHAPVVLQPSRLATVHITVDGGRVTMIRQETGLLPVLRRLGLDLEPVSCGGDDPAAQEREQWHSGANAFAFAPGKVLVYGRNARTLAELDRRGFAIVPARDVMDGRADLAAMRRCAVTIEGAELARGGGGCRCMTLPVRRAPLA
jgi:arginine deiminase